jgi:uncharacterized protein
MFSDSEKANWEERFERRVAESCRGTVDAAHDLAHFKRVVATAKALCASEKACWEVVVPAAWLHDLVLVPKNDPRRSQASRLSAQAAVEFLRSEKYPEKLLEDIAHAIEAHSYSAGIEARTLEAKIVQDADRLDGVGAIGVARCFTVGAVLGRPFYDVDDPFAAKRTLDDSVNTLDHFYVKLFKTVDSLKTDAGRLEGRRRAETMRAFLADFRRELNVSLT